MGFAFFELSENKHAPAAFDGAIFNWLKQFSSVGLVISFSSNFCRVHSLICYKVNNK
jgi:hypothetical protein